MRWEVKKNSKLRGCRCRIVKNKVIQIVFNMCRVGNLKCILRGWCYIKITIPLFPFEMDLL